VACWIWSRVWLREHRSNMAEEVLGRSAHLSAESVADATGDPSKPFPVGLAPRYLVHTAWKGLPRTAAHRSAIPKSTERRCERPARRSLLRVPVGIRLADIAALRASLLASAAAAHAKVGREAG